MIEKNGKYLSNGVVHVSGTAEIINGIVFYISFPPQPPPRPRFIAHSYPPFSNGSLSPQEPVSHSSLVSNPGTNLPPHPEVPHTPISPMGIHWPIYQRDTPLLVMLFPKCGLHIQPPHWQGNKKCSFLRTQTPPNSCPPGPCSLSNSPFLSHPDPRALLPSY